MARRPPPRQSAAGPGRSSPAAQPGSTAADRRQARRAEAQLRLQRRRLAVTAVVAVAVLVASAGMLDWWAGASEPESAAAPSESPAATPTRAPSPLPSSPEPAPESTDPPPVLSLPGDFPFEGPGTFTFADGEGAVLGESGQLRQFRLAVEDGTDEDLAALAAFVDETLGHEQSWTAGGDVRFQRVPDGAGHDFTIYLATSQTTGQRCAAGGLDVLAPGLPEGGVSCRVANEVVLNLARWRLSVAHYVDAGVELEVYRQMVLNHEVGHELGYGHYGCPGEGQPAPVMQQQTLRLDGCEANPWPYLDGVHHTGPSVP